MSEKNGGSFLEKLKTTEKLYIHIIFIRYMKYKTFTGQFLQNQPNQDENQEMLSTSSLRRKLFFQGDNSGIALSPVK